MAYFDPDAQQGMYQQTDFPRKPPSRAIPSSGRQTSPKRVQRQPGGRLPPNGGPRFPPNGGARYPPHRGPSVPKSRYVKRTNAPHYTRRTIGSPAEIHAHSIELSDTEELPPIPYRKSSEPFNWRQQQQQPPRQQPHPNQNPPYRSPTGPRPTVQNSGRATSTSPTGPLSTPNKLYQQAHRPKEPQLGGHLSINHHNGHHNAHHNPRPMDRHVMQRRQQFPPEMPRHQFSPERQNKKAAIPQFDTPTQAVGSKRGEIRKIFDQYAFNNHLTSIGFQLALSDLGLPGSEFLAPPSNQPISFLQFVRICLFRQTE